MTFCILGENCSVFDRVAKTPGMARSNPLCEGCRNAAERDLNLLRYDYVDLSQVIAKSGGHSDVKISRPKPESSPLLDLTVYTLRSRIFVTARAVEAALRVRLGSPSVPLVVREGFGLDAAIRYLHPRVQDIARLGPTWGDFDDGGAEMDGPAMIVVLGVLHRRARRVCGLDPRTLGLPGDCPSCSVPSLRRHDDDLEWIWCANCLRVLTRGQYFSAMQLAVPVTGCVDPR